MAKTFDPKRVLPGTIELVRDANGNYTTKVVGLETINSLSLPDISTTAAVTKTDTDTKTATTELEIQHNKLKLRWHFKLVVMVAVEPTDLLCRQEAKKLVIC